MFKLEIKNKIAIAAVVFSAAFVGMHAYADIEKEAVSDIATKAQTKSVSALKKDLSPAPKDLEIKGVFETQLADELAHDKSYRVGPDDELKITVYDEKNLSSTYAVSGNGFISMPLIGDIKVEGLTLKDIENRITLALSDGYLIDPSVAIEVSEYRPFYILGEVRSPGSYSYVNNMSVLNAVALAGGFTYRADKKKVEILRSRDQDGSMLKDQPVETNVTPGDIILVRERFF